MTNEQMLRDAAQQAIDAIKKSFDYWPLPEVVDDACIALQAALAQPATAQAEQMKPVVRYCGMCDQEVIEPCSSVDCPMPESTAQAEKQMPPVDHGDAGREFYALCELLPSETYWGDDLTPAIVRHIRDSLATPQPQPATAQMEQVKPTHDQMMAGYEVACKFGVLEGRAFMLAEEMYCAMLSAQNTDAIAQQPAIPAGYVIVPIEPTPEMMTNGSGCKHHAWDDLTCSARRNRLSIWNAMIAAAPPIQPAQRDSNKGELDWQWTDADLPEILDAIRALKSGAIAATQEETK